MRIGEAAWALILTAVVALAQPADPAAPMRDAIAAMQRGDFPSAEKKLRAEIAAHPDHAMALSLLGVALDNLKRSPEAADFHRRAVAKSPRSPDVLNNYAAHLWLAGNEKEARSIYLKVVAIDAWHYQANLQLARLALKEKNAADAMRYLDRLPAPQRDKPEILLLRMEASYLGGSGAQGDTLSSQLLQMSRTDLKLSFAAGMALTNAHQYGKGQEFFENALKIDPSDFNLLYNTGVAASYAGHHQRAREVLAAALAQQPQNVDVLYALAFATEALNQYESAVRLLAQAGKLAPRRADVQRLLALTTFEMGALDDATDAWDRYLQLEPNDETAQRERSYTLAKRGKLDQAIPGLESFAAKHPGDVVGHYELGQAQRSVDTAKALAHLDKAIELDPNYAPARTARGSLYYQDGRPEAAVKDLEIAVSLRPDDAAGLDRLGQAYAALDRASDAVRVLRKAAQLAPDDSKTLLHFARALADAGNMDESKTVMDRFRNLGPEKQNVVPPGLVEYMSLTEDQRRADYRARVEKTVQSHPEDATARLALLKLLLQDGVSDRVTETVRGFAGLNPSASLLADAGRVLLAAKWDALAVDLLTKAAVDPPADMAAGIARDLAIATLRAGDAAKGLALLDRVPASARAGDYYLARAEILMAAESQVVRAAIDQALRTAPPSTDFYLYATAFLVRNKLDSEALRFLDQAAGSLPGDREILLLRAGALDLLGRTGDAEHLFGEIENRWPEWYPAWAAHGIVAKAHHEPAKAQHLLDTAKALGAPAGKLGIDLRSILEGALSQ